MKTEVLKIRNTVYGAIHNYFRTAGFFEVAPPILTSFSCEVACVGGSDLISVNYYDKKAYLSQSGQLYLEALAMQLDKVYCIDPAFRAEATMLATHLSEFWMCEAELTDVSFDQLVDIVNGLIESVIKAVLQNNRAELIALGSDVACFERIAECGCARINYCDAIEALKDQGVAIEWGDDIEAEHELILSRVLGDVPFAITRYPMGLSSFYKQVCPEDDRYSLSFDVIAPNGYRELVGGSMREPDADKLRTALEKASGGDTSAYDWYLELIAENPREHGGFGLGIERFLTWICNLDTIQDSIPFPRTENKITP